MSWVEVARRALESAGARVFEGQRGLEVLPASGASPKLLILARRMHMSLDCKVEAIGFTELPRPPEPTLESLRRMLELSFEVELRGVIRKSFAWSPWRELRKLESVVGPLLLNTKLLEELKGRPELTECLAAASPNMVEVFPEVMPLSYMEAFLLAPGVPVTPLIRELIADYLGSPERLAWCFKLQFLYGLPMMPKKIVKNYQLAVQLDCLLREVTPRLL